jgi:hypothetical protein
MTLPFPTPNSWAKLWYADSPIGEIAEHLVGVAGHGMARHAAGLSEEEERASLLAIRHGSALAACKAIDRSVGED